MLHYSKDKFKYALYSPMSEQVDSKNLYVPAQAHHSMGHVRCLLLVASRRMRFFVAPSLRSDTLSLVLVSAKDLTQTRSRGDVAPSTDFDLEEHL